MRGYQPGAQSQAQGIDRPQGNLSLGGQYSGHAGDFWNQRRRMQNDASQQQIHFDAQKSALMNPAWHETLQRQSGQFDPRSYGKDFYGRKPQYSEAGSIGSRYGG